MKKTTRFIMPVLALTLLVSCTSGQPEPTPTTTFTVMFDGNGGTLISGTEIQKVSKASEIVAPNYARDGYTFNGWDKELATITTDTTVKAQWIVTPTPVETFTVTFNTNGGSLVPAQTVEKGKFAIRPTNPIKPGYSLGGWYEDITLKTDYYFLTPVTSNITLYAKWVEEKVGDCTYKLNNDQKSYSVSGVSDKTCTSYNILTKYNNLPVTSIGDYAFDNCIYLNTINIPTSITSIGQYAFRSDLSLISLTIPSSVTFLDDDAFYNCMFLTHVSLQNGLVSIGRGAFALCYYLQSINIPNTVISIGDGAFSACIYLASINIPSNVTSIGSGIFESCTSLSSITVDSNNPKYDSRNNCNAIIETTSNTLISGCSSTIIPNSVTYIEDFAFQGISITSISFPNSVKTVGIYAFNQCQYLTSVSISNSVILFKDNAFAGCPSLTTITVDSSNPKYDSRENCNAIIETSTNTLISGCKDSFIPTNVTSLGKSSFAGCLNLKSITIPDSVLSIGEIAFYLCPSLASITIPDSVTSIGYRAFENCTSLSSISYTGTKEQWNKIEKGSSWHYKCPATVVHCADGDIALD